MSKIAVCINIYLHSGNGQFVAGNIISMTSELVSRNTQHQYAFMIVLSVV